MAERRVLTPSADHPITITPNPARVIVRIGDQIIADTRNALTLQEGSYPPVHYIPREDADMALFARSDHASYCPYKGDAGYFDLQPLAARGADAVWTYETPYPAVAPIAGHLAFYPDRVTITEVPG
jgi:uncharacterized protein (DUF427 family)